MSNVTTGPTRVDLVEVATGVQVSRWPVDARELLATGDYVRVEDYVASDAEAVDLKAEGNGEQPDPDAGSETATEGDESVSTNRRRR